MLACQLLLAPVLAITLLGAPRPLAVVPFTDNGLLVSLQVRANGRAFKFSLDSGASASVIDTQAARAIRLKEIGSKRGGGAGAGTVKFLIYKDVRLALGAAHWTPPIAYGISLARVGTQQREDGLIGSDFFYRYVVSIDYANHKMTLYDPRSFSYAGSGSAIPISIRKHVPYIPVLLKMQGRRAMMEQVLVDSGSEDQIDSPMIGTSTAGKKRITAGVGLGRRFQSFFGPIEWARLGKYQLRNLVGTTGRAMMGSSVLRHFTVTFDYSRRTLYLERADHQRSGTNSRRALKWP